MKVRCIETTLKSGHEYNIVKTQTYLVLGISFYPRAGEEGAIVFEILNDFGASRGVPASLFEIIDNRCSRYWKSQVMSSGTLVLWPDEFFIEYFHDDLSEGIAETVEHFKNVVDRLQTEFNEVSVPNVQCE